LRYFEFTVQVSNLSNSAILEENATMRSIIVAGLLLCCTFSSAQPSKNPAKCGFPPALQDEVTKKYPGARVVTVNDLSVDDKNFFRKDHGNTCPGLAKVDFYGDGKPTWALVLINSAKKRLDLVVAHRLDAWKLQALDSLEAGPIPVVWRDRPGKYDDVYGEKTLTSAHPVVVLCQYEAWAIVYAWTGKEVEKVWISD
jgi:hypothetical protein